MRLITFLPQKRLSLAFGVLMSLFAFVACSNTASATVDDEEDSSSSKVLERSSASSKSSSSGKVETSSSSKITEESSSSDDESSSSVSVDDVDEDCVGEAGNPWDGTTAKNFACGTGTKYNPYVILTAEQLAHLSFVIGAKDSNYLDKYYKLGADILLNEGQLIDDSGALVTDSTKLHKWTPIGNSNVAFAGSFDGNGHVVSEMFINTTSTHNGLFGNVSGTVQNVTVGDSWVYGGKYTAGVVGYNVGTISNLTNMASVTAIDDCVGGVVGDMYRKNNQYNSIGKKLYNSGFIFGKNNVGGVAGCATFTTMDSLENNASISGYGYVGGVIGGVGSTKLNEFQHTKNSGTVEGNHFVGGIMGHCAGSPSISQYNNTSSFNCWPDLYPCGSISAAYNGGSVIGKRYVGGIAGEACSGTITDVANVADIEGDYGVGGIVGSITSSTVTSLYNTGNVKGSDYVGGIFSYNKEGVTSSAYSTGKVDGDSLVGLMIGYNYNTTMADYYYLEQGEQEPFGKNDGGGVATPKNADEMKSKDFAELLGEDFIYDSGLNDGYPVLSWE